MNNKGGINYNLSDVALKYSKKPKIQKLFADVVRLYHEDISERAVKGEDAKIWNLGVLKVLKKERDLTKKKGINWGASNKFKKQLLEVGEPIRTKDNPEGQNWLIPYVDPYVFEYYLRKATYLKNKRLYYFKCNRRLKRALNNEVVTNSNSLLKYTKLIPHRNEL